MFRRAHRKRKKKRAEFGAKFKTPSSHYSHHFYRNIRWLVGWNYENVWVSVCLVKDRGCQMGAIKVICLTDTWLWYFRVCRGNSAPTYHKYVIIATTYTKNTCFHPSYQPKHSIYPTNYRWAEITDGCSVAFIFRLEWHCPWDSLLLTKVVCWWSIRTVYTKAAARMIRADHGVFAILSSYSKRK